MAMGMIPKSKWLTNMEYDTFLQRVNTSLQSHKNTTDSQFGEAVMYIRHLDNMTNGRDEFFKLVDTSLSQFPTCKWLTIDEYNDMLQKMNKSMQSYNRTDNIVYEEAAMIVKKLSDATHSKEEFIQMIERQLTKLNDQKKPAEQKHIDWFNAKRADFQRILSKVKSRKEVDLSFRESLEAKGISNGLEILQNLLALKPNEINDSTVGQLIRVKKSINELKFEMQKPKTSTTVTSKNEEIFDREVLSLCLYDISVVLKLYLFGSGGSSKVIHTHWANLLAKSRQIYVKLSDWLKLFHSRQDHCFSGRAQSFLLSLSGLTTELEKAIEVSNTSNSQDGLVLPPIPDSATTGRVDSRVICLLAITEDLLRCEGPQRTSGTIETKRRRLVEESVSQFHIAIAGAEATSTGAFTDTSLRELQALLVDVPNAWFGSTSASAVSASTTANATNMNVSTTVGMGVRESRSGNSNIISTKKRTKRPVGVVAEITARPDRERLLIRYQISSL